MERIDCPVCGKPMKETDVEHKKARTYDDCIRKCVHCTVGASNAMEKPTFIFKDYQAGIPSDLRPNLEVTLKNSQNIRNRDNKVIKFGYSTSEDALTWIFIKYHIVHKRLNSLKMLFSLENDIQEILLWGVQQITTDKKYEDKLQQICKDLKENENSLSEPDIIIITDKEVVFIEVKLKSANEVRGNTDDRFNKYMNNLFYSNEKSVIESGHYELVRNWTIGNTFAEGKKFKLINLGPAKLFSGKNEAKLKSFTESLPNKSRFEKLTWEHVFEKMESDNHDREIMKNIKTRFETAAAK